MDRSTFLLMTTMVSPSASSANTVVSMRMNWMFAKLRNRGCTRVVTSTNTARTATMPDSRMRNTRSARPDRLRGPAAAGGSADGGPHREAALPVAPGTCAPPRTPR